MYQYQSMHVFGQKKNLMKCKAGLSVLWYDRTSICPSVASMTLSLALAIPMWSISLPQHRSKCLWESFSCMVRHVWGIWRTSYCTSRVLLHWTKSFSFMSQIKSTSSSSLWSCFFAAYSTLCRDHWSDLFVYEMYFLIYNNTIIG